MKTTQSDSVVFRRTAEADLEFVMAIEQEAAANYFVEAWSRSRHAQTLTEPDKLHLVIESVDTKPVGFMLLAGVGSPDRSIEFRRIVIGPKNQGLGRQAVRLLKRYAFADLGAHRLWLDVKEFNDRARSLYRSEGFVEEGTLRDCVKSSTGFESLVVMSMLESEYKPS